MGDTRLAIICPGNISSPKFYDMYSIPGLINEITITAKKKRK